MHRNIQGILVIGLLAAPARGQPREWSDDFATAATYDSVSLYGPCRGGSPTKYTLFEALTGDVYNGRVVAGNGRFEFTCRSLFELSNFGRFDFAIVGWYGTGISCPGAPANGETSEPFTSDNICIYGGYRFNPLQLRLPPRFDSWDMRGPDGKPGVANVDDDLDGTTDENNESPGARTTIVAGGYGNGDGTGFHAGVDGTPGAAGVDDDGNGIVDDVGETSWPGTDDGDDVQRYVWYVVINGDVQRTRFMQINVDVFAGAIGQDVFALREIYDGATHVVEWSNEVSATFYKAYKHYNWVLCASGSCYGAQLWTEADLANPDETLGPVINTQHTAPTADKVGFGAYQGTTPRSYLRQMNWMTNTNFSDRYWVVSGNPAQYYPSPSPDLDGDRDVDGFDFLTFSNCYNGSNKPPLAACANARADLDRDGDVDGFDFLTFSNCYNGSNRKPLAACFPPNLTACGS
jgi:hypothetical protein